MTLNADLVRSRCADIEEAVVRLERFGSMPVEQFVGNYRNSLPDLRAFGAAVVRLI
jgi:hypothetical protein